MSATDFTRWVGWCIQTTLKSMSSGSRHKRRPVGVAPPLPPLPDKGTLAVPSDDAPPMSPSQRLLETRILDIESPLSRLSRDSVGYKVSIDPKMRHGYLFGNKIGEGSYGKVKEAINMRTKTRVALKIVKEAQLRKIAGGEQAIEREVNVLKSLRNDHIIHFVECFTNVEKGKLYVALELVQGCSVGRLCESFEPRRMPVRLARSLFRQLLRALEYMHGLGVVHRDIKPENLMVNREARLKVIDFGVAVFIADAHNSKSTGSPAYTPPEVASGATTFSGPTMDVWAAGITLYQMCVGDYPFDAPNAYSLFDVIVKCNYVVPDFVQADLRDLLPRILEKLPEKRYDIRDIKKHSFMRAKLRTDPRTDAVLAAQTRFSPLYNDDVLREFPLYDSDDAQSSEGAYAQKALDLSWLEELEDGDERKNYMMRVESKRRVKA